LVVGKGAFIEQSNQLFVFFSSIARIINLVAKTLFPLGSVSEPKLHQILKNKPPAMKVALLK